MEWEKMCNNRAKYGYKNGKNRRRKKCIGA